MSGLLSHKPVGGASCQGYFHINLLVVLHVRVTFTLTCWWCFMSGLLSHKPVGAPCQGYFHLNLLVVLHVRVTFT